MLGLVTALALGRLSGWSLSALPAQRAVSGTTPAKLSRSPTRRSGVTADGAEEAGGPGHPAAHLNPSKRSSSPPKPSGAQRSVKYSRDSAARAVPSGRWVKKKFSTWLA